MKIEFEVEGVTPKARPRFSRGRTFTPKRTKDAEARVRDAYRGASLRRFGEVVVAPERTKVAVEMRFIQPAPKTRPKWLPKALWDLGLMPFTCTPDIDNLIKAILDGLNPYKDRDGRVSLVAWHDDAQVTVIRAEKMDRPRQGTPKTEVAVSWDE